MITVQQTIHARVMDLNLFFLVPRLIRVFNYSHHLYLDEKFDTLWKVGGQCNFTEATRPLKSL